MRAQRGAGGAWEAARVRYQEELLRSRNTLCSNPAHGCASLFLAAHVRLVSLMPQRAAAICRHPGCGALVRDGSGRCEKHPHKWTAWGDNSKRTVRGAAYAHARRSLFARTPLCVSCQSRGRDTLATIRDHVIPLEWGGADDDSNVQALCVACHDEKSKHEREVGAARARESERKALLGLDGTRGRR